MIVNGILLKIYVHTSMIIVIFIERLLQIEGQNSFYEYFRDVLKSIVREYIMMYLWSAKIRNFILHFYGCICNFYSTMAYRQKLYGTWKNMLYCLNRV